ncbi:MAG TPA: LysM domain-containing protein [Blastocatellia bacterium]|nr:LysM domain-containing protein [Blastocatellia bacterium]
MSDRTSRYHDIEIAKTEITDSDGSPRIVAYERRRFIPSAGGMTTLVEHTVTQGERLDNITARYLGDPTQFWQVCDANNAMRPDDLTDTVGRIIKIALPGF